MLKILYTLLLLLPFQAAAQESETGNWMMYFGNQKLSDRWNWHNEIQYRNYNFAGDLEQLLLRTGIGYNLSANNNNLLLGYAYIHGEPYIAGTDEKTNVNEHRIFQQFISRQQFGRFYLQHRYRIEERFIEDDFKMRFRYFLGLNVPINKKEMVSKAICMAARYASPLPGVSRSTTKPALACPTPDTTKNTLQQSKYDGYAFPYVCLRLKVLPQLLILLCKNTNMLSTAKMN